MKQRVLGSLLQTNRKPRQIQGMLMRTTTYASAALILFACVLFLWNNLTRQRPSSVNFGLRSSIAGSDSQEVRGPCAINLYGLPRSFKDIVLPMFIQNVVIPNRKYECDFFIHYHHRLSEPPGRDGRGGTIDPDEILLVEAAIMNATDYRPIVAFVRTSEEQFKQTYHELLEILHTTTDVEGGLLYMPINHPSYDYDTVDNVIKMFHGQAAVWELMSSAEREKSLNQVYHYSRVAMLRNDVFYATPIDIYRLPDGSIDVENELAVIPGFSQHPVNDRLIYGPYDAVRIWAATRFERLWKHIEFIRQFHPGDGIHSERFLAFTIFPAIRDAGIAISVDSGMCFLRVRSDHSIRLDDCGLPGANMDATQLAVEAILKRKCRQNRSKSPLVHLECD